jgi:hypothetical protein
MEQTTAQVNAFTMMTTPEVIFAALERSDRLARLKSTICRPLDKPRQEHPPVDVKAFDEQVESAPVEEAPADEARADE